MPRHWQPHSPKRNWISYIRNFLVELYCEPVEMKSLDKLSRGDAIILAEVLADAVKWKRNSK